MMTMPEEKLTAEQNTLVQAWMPMAHGVAKSFWERSQKQLPLDELISMAYQGLIRAAQRFDPNRPGNDAQYEVNAGFGQYAKQVVTGAILDWQRSQDHVTRRQRQTYKRLQEMGHGSGRSAEELSEITGLAVDKIRDLVAAVETTAVSLDDTWDSNQGPSSEVENSVLASSITNRLADTLREFPETQQFVVVLRYYSGYDFPTIAAVLGVSAMTVRSMHHEAIAELNSVMQQSAYT